MNIILGRRKRFRKAGYLHKGDILRLSSSTEATVENIWIEVHEEDVVVYNFEVADFHTYFVSELGVLVHNSCGAKVTNVSEKANKEIRKKWEKKGVDAFEKAMNKGIVGPEGQSGIKLLKGKPYKGKYTYEIKVKNGEYANYRVYGYKDNNGNLIFDYFDKALH